MADTFGDAPIPLGDPIARAPRKGFQDDPLAGMLTEAWQDYFTHLVKSVDIAPARISNASLVKQAASVGATSLSGTPLNAGLYRVSWYARITRAAGTSSSLTVSIAWTDTGVAQSFSGAAITGNTVLTNQSQSVLVNIDGNTPLTYSTTYASVGAPTMQHSLYLTLEAVKA